MELQKIGLGGGCHWCTEGVFQSLIGVHKVEQGWIASGGENAAYSEAIVVHFNPQEIDLKDLVEIHLLTHSSDNNHKRRDKYRSAVYIFEEGQGKKVETILKDYEKREQKQIITKILVFVGFKLNIEEQLSYFYKNPDLPFCSTYIIPKLQLLLKKHSKLMNGVSRDLVRQKSIKG